MKNIFLILLAFSSMVFSSCSDWFDVNPITELKEEEIFSDEVGFYEALIGIYIASNEENVYGKNLSYYFVDNLAQYYEVSGTSTETVAAIQDYDYTHSSVETIVNNIWSGLYYLIANCNNILTNLETTEVEFIEGNKEILEAELKALRAYYHFDLLRLFAPSPASTDGLSQLAIPYVNKVTTVAFPQSTVQEVLDCIIADLKDAKVLLDAIDPDIFAGNEVYSKDDYFYDNGFRANRSYRMNYLAVSGILSRVYLYAGDYVNAYETAKFVYENTTAVSFSDYGPFADNIASLYMSRDDIEPSGELYFSDYSTTRLSLSDTYRENLYESNSYPSADMRATTLWEVRSGETLKNLSKFIGNYDIAKTFINRAEICLILAETATANDDDPLVYINDQRTSRGLEAYPLTSTTSLSSEIEKEYKKEFIGEGELFYYYKRLNVIDFIGPNNYYVDNFNNLNTLPIPDDEYTYGNIQ